MPHEPRPAPSIPTESGREGSPSTLPVAEGGTVTPTPGSTPVCDDPGRLVPAIAPAGYELLDEIGRGGMGVVYRARDVALNRDVAVKMLPERFGPESAAARRFVDEAQITGQLQHPGIPAVHQAGLLPDGRPFLAMKLIKGRTLEALLKERPDPTADRGRFVAVFEQVCQAVGYAHAHRIIHRDLKPANVMVGAFGEVQVMDWGLAKALTRGGRSPEEMSSEETMPPTEIRSQRNWDEATRAGSVLGTPAYMPPEQAIGAVDQIDARSDVFGLGAVLCAILTGKPPYVGGDPESTRQIAARAKLADAHARLDASRAEPDLVALCKRCLSVEKTARPTDAGKVAAAVADLRQAAEERARQAELDRVRAEGDSRAIELKAVEERKRRRVQLALAAAMLVLVAGGGAFAWWQDRQATERRTEAAGRAKNNAEAIAALLKSCEDALRAGNTDQATALLEEVERRISEGGSDKLNERLDSCRADLAVLRELDAIDQFRWTLVENNRYPAPEEVAARLRAALKRFGIVLGESPVDQAGQRVASSAVRDRLIAALDRWLGAEPSADLRAVLRTVDPDPYRDTVRDAVLAKDRTRVMDLATQPGASDQPPGFAVFLGENSAVGVRRRRELLRAALVRRPGDLGLLMAMGTTYSVISRDVAVERVRWFQAAVGVAPNIVSAHNALGRALQTKGDLDGAIAEIKEAIRLEPRYADAHHSLGFALNDKKDLDGAIAAYQTAIHLNPKHLAANHNLGNALYAKKDLDGAIAAYKTAIRISPTYTQAYIGMASALEANGDMDGATAAYREAIRISPKYATAHNNLAWLLATGPDGVRDGRRAVELATKACELNEWKFAGHLDTLAAAYAEIGEFDKAVEYQKKSLSVWHSAGAIAEGKDAQQRLDLYTRKVPYRDPELAVAKARIPAPPPREAKR